MLLPLQWVQSLGWEDPLEKGMATHSSILAWRSHGVAKSWTWLSNSHTHTHTHLWSVSRNYGQSSAKLWRIWVMTGEICYCRHSGRYPSKMIRDLWLVRERGGWESCKESVCFWRWHVGIWVAWSLPAVGPRGMQSLGLEAQCLRGLL